MLVLAFTTFPAAHASIEAVTADQSGTIGQTVEAALRNGDGTAISVTEDAAGLGGAVYNPFSATAEKPVHRTAAKAWYLDVEWADLTLTVATAVGFVSALAYVLRRTLDS
jgi:hypothetical protein